MEILRERARKTFSDLEAARLRPARRAIPTFGEYIDVWAESGEMRNVTPAWRTSKLSAARMHCGDLLGLKIDEIERNDVRRLLTDLDKRGYTGVLRIVRSIINQIFELAIDDGVIPEDHPIPIPRGLKLKRNRRERRLNGEELGRLVAALIAYKGNDRSDAASFRLVVLLALFTAQRRGNILQMRWDEIDNVRRIWTIPAEKAKTRRAYRVALDDTVWDLLQGQRKNLLRSGQSGPWVFPSYAGAHAALGNIKRPWAWVVTHAGLENFRFHDLRHSAASIAYEASQDLKGTQLFLQHADSRTTSDTYIHTVDTAPQIRASGAVVKALCGAANVEKGSLCGMVMSKDDEDDQEESMAILASRRR